MNVIIGRYPSYNKKLGVQPERKIKVRVDPWDTWSMDHTLAYIIHPMLVQLKATKHGSPNVAMEDVPPHLRSEVATDPVTFETDEHWHARWNWVLDEMIWAFAQVLDEDAEDQFHTGDMDLRWLALDANGTPLGEPVELGDTKSPTPVGTANYKLVQGPNHTHKVDEEGLAAWEARKQNGFRLFGVYYQNLWD
jgi:hypothetical protein